MNILPTNYSMIDTGLSFRGCPVFLGADHRGRTPDRLVLTLLDRFLRENLPKQLIEMLTNYSTGALVRGAIPEGEKNDKT